MIMNLNFLFLADKIKIADQTNADGVHFTRIMIKVIAQLKIIIQFINNNFSA